MQLTSTAFNHMEAIPAKHARDGADISPPLAWRGVPDEAKALALICEDPDAPQERPWVHWVVMNIPIELQEVGEGSGPGSEGMNDFGESGYGGPMPPPGHGLHHYHFRLFALDKPIEVGKGLTRDRLEEAIRGHVLDEAELIGTYERTEV